MIAALLIIAGLVCGIVSVTEIIVRITSANPNS